MKRKDLLQRIAQQATRSQVEWVLLRQGANHEVWQLGGRRIAVPRHRDINELTANGNLKDCEPVLGERWWK